MSDTTVEFSAAAAPLAQKLLEPALEIIARYPEGRERSALLPLLHLVQTEEGYVSPAGVAFCAEVLGINKAQVGAVATFYTMYKRRPTGEYLVSVCTNTMCNVLGGQEVYDGLVEHLGVGHDETTADGSITLEHAECLAACDYGPVVTVDYEFYDQQDVESARALVEALRRGDKPHPTRGAPLTDFRGISRQLAGFSQHPDATAARAAVDARGEWGPTLIGLQLAEQRGESAPAMPRRREQPAPDTAQPAAATRPSGASGQTPEKEAGDARVAAADTPAERAGAAQSHPDAGAEYGRRRTQRSPRGGAGTPAPAEPGGGYQGPAAGGTRPTPPRKEA